jgi:HEAT repeat protein
MQARQNCVSGVGDRHAEGSSVKRGGVLLLALLFVAAKPYERQIHEHRAQLRAQEPDARARAAEALGFLRAYPAADALALTLADESPAVRRNAALALAWCGGRAQVPALLAALDDVDWSVRQSAWVALTNLTGMEWPFDAMAAPAARAAQTARWRTWWSEVPADQPPREVLDLVHSRRGAGNLASGCAVTASSVYKGPAGAVTDGDPATFWQTKQTSFPQHCDLDLGKAVSVGCVVVEQYGLGYCMTDVSVSTRLDGGTFSEVRRWRTNAARRLVLAFPPREARYIRITAHAGENPLYPTTFREVGVFAGAPDAALAEAGRVERGARALGALGGAGATESVLEVLRSCLHNDVSPDDASAVQAALRSAGRLRDPAALPVLLAFLDNTKWARYAAEALGDFGGEEAAAALAAAYPRYARSLDGKDPERVPADDRPGFESLDRMYETPFQIASALARLPADPATLRALAPLILANLPSDFDGAVLYEPEACQQITAHLLEVAGLREAACEAALAELGAEAATGDQGFNALAKRRHGDLPIAAQWLPVLCRDPNRMIPLLSHSNGWVRINAAKTLMFLGATGAVDRLAGTLAESRTEAEYGYFGDFLFDKAPQGQDEHNDPPPRWREAFVRALGRLNAARHVGLLARLLKDDRNALEIHYAAAVALDEIGTKEAVTALQQTAATHPFHSVRLVAREALWKRGVSPEAVPAVAPVAQTPGAAPASRPQAGAIVFIKGPNRMPNRFQIDPWRQTYSTTDSGPTYRLGWNLFVLREGKAAALTDFKDGWVADCEVSPDGRRVIFARRGGDTNPWWHVWEIGADGAGLRQLTHGPYHDVQPNYLPDGRMVFASTRIGTRDEYHGYAATGLTVMNADGSDPHCIGFNLGRDNEPAVLPDGRIVFSRLELFYSRLKTELTLQAVFPDGTRNVTLYGPERRPFWHDITRKSGEDWWGEAPMRHRVLRLTQPEAWEDGRVLCATTGGLTLAGPGRYEETVLPHDPSLAVTSPFPLRNGRILCAAVKKSLSREEGNLGLYELDPATGAMELLYRDSKAASFEARPLTERKTAPVLCDDPRAQGTAYSGQVFCRSAGNSQLPTVSARGRLVRVIEGMPIVARHHTHRSPVTQAWKNHVGTQARVLGTVPLAADGSFLLDVPADRLIHLQVLDSDRRVVGNQQIWMYVRPGERRSCAGCHEAPDTAAQVGTAALASAVTVPALSLLPTGDEFIYRAKAWQKGELADAAEERTRTAGAVNLLGRQ